MAISSSSCLALTMLVAFLLLGSSGQASAQDCGVDVVGLWLQCQPYVLIPGPKIPPSPACCTVAKTIDVPCACQKITKEIERAISVDKVLFVAQSCGVPVPHGQKCGDITVPMA